MIVLLIAALVLVVGLVVAVVVGKVGADSMAAPTRTSSFELPDGRIGSQRVEELRIDQSLRGYNMTQVDEILDRLTLELRELESQLGLSGWPGTAKASDVRLTKGSAEDPRAGADVVELRRSRGADTSGDSPGDIDTVIEGNAGPTEPQDA